MACRQVKVKRELLRVVRVADGNVEIDSGGKKSGRGAYLCRAEECWEAGIKGGRLEHSLRTAITQENRDQLSRFGKDFLKEQVSGKGW